MPFVLDASIAACWAFDDEDHPTAALALERIRTDEAFVPALWWFEIRNTLVVNERRKRLSESDTAAFLRGIAARFFGDTAPWSVVEMFSRGAPATVPLPSRTAGAGSRSPA